MKKLLVFLFSVILLVSIGVMYYKNGIKAVGGNKSVTFTVEKGDTYSSLGSKLKSSGLIKSEFIINYKFVFIDLYKIKIVL